MVPEHASQCQIFFCLGNAANDRLVEAGMRHSSWPQIPPASPAVGLSPRVAPNYVPVLSKEVRPHMEHVML